jgi:hypothetical protein
LRGGRLGPWQLDDLTVEAERSPPGSGHADLSVRPTIKISDGSPSAKGVAITAPSMLVRRAEIGRFERAAVAITLLSPSAMHWHQRAPEVLGATSTLCVGALLVCRVSRDASRPDVGYDGAGFEQRDERRCAGRLQSTEDWPGSEIEE